MFLLQIIYKTPLLVDVSHKGMTILMFASGRLIFDDSEIKLDEIHAPSPYLILEETR